MPNIPSLSGSYIDQTYPRLVQVSGSSFADGLGNPISIGISGGTDTYIPLWSGSNALTSSCLVQSSPNILFTRFPEAETGLAINYASGSYAIGDYAYYGSGSALSISDTNQTILTLNQNEENGLRLDFFNMEYKLGTLYGPNSIYLLVGQDTIQTSYKNHNSGFYFDMNGSRYRIGDYGGYRNGVYIDIDDDNNRIETYYSGSKVGLQIDNNNGTDTYTLGQYNNGGNKTKLIVDDYNQTIILSGSVAISGSATLNDITLEPASVDDIDLSISAYTITSWGVYRITTATGPTNYYLNLPDPNSFPGREICLINSDQIQQAYFGDNAPYKLSGDSGWGTMEPNIMMILKSIGGKWIGPKIPES
jgi:hypothetical protein